VDSLGHPGVSEVSSRKHVFISHHHADDEHVTKPIEGSAAQNWLRHEVDERRPCACGVRACEMPEDAEGKPGRFQVSRIYDSSTGAYQHSANCKQRAIDLAQWKAEPSAIRRIADRKAN